MIQIYDPHFSPDGAESPQRGLTPSSAAGPAETDSACLLRLPVWFNHEYAQPYQIPAHTSGHGMTLRCGTG